MTTYHMPDPLKCLLFLMLFGVHGSSCGQQLFQSSLNQEGAESLYDLEVLPDGDLILVGRSEESLLLVRSTALGDTLWTRVYSGMGIGVEVQRTFDDRISVLTAEPNAGVHVFDPLNGDVLHYLPNVLSGYCWPALDSILHVRNDSLILQHVNGDVGWSSRIVVPDQELLLEHCLQIGSGRFVTWGKARSEPGLLYERLWLGVHESDGTLVDSVGFTGNFTYSNGLRTALDGGFLAYGTIGSGTPLWVVGDADGVILSVRGFLDIQQGDLGMLWYGIRAMVQRPDGSFVCLGNAGYEQALEQIRTIVEMDEELVVTCHRTMDIGPGMQHPQWNMELGPDGITYFCGYMSTEGDTNDAAQWAAWDDLCYFPTSLEEVQTDKAGVYPQPSTGVFNVRVPSYATGPFSVTIQDARGTTLGRSVSNSSPIQVDLTGRDPGVHHLMITAADGTCWPVPLMLVGQ